ncbi:MAG: hypothetical protein CMJ80_06385 [Planctomycetaceae bacterium]|nr:hypothetical protein [Planctomycetaceae bacterium]
MSLFENEEYQWRETFFILFQEENRPDAAQVETLLREIDPRYRVSNVRATDTGLLESLTLESPDDYSAMDISLVYGDEVTEQTTELMAELIQGAETNEEKLQIESLATCRCRFDIYHFEQLVFVGRDDGAEDGGDDFMDPGAVLTVMEKIATVCNGIVVDPQANTII